MVSLKKLCEKTEKTQFDKEVLRDMLKAFPDVELPKEILEAIEKQKVEFEKPIFLKRYE